MTRDLALSLIMHGVLFAVTVVYNNWSASDSSILSSPMHIQIVQSSPQPITPPKKMPTPIVQKKYHKQTTPTPKMKAKPPLFAQPVKKKSLSQIPAPQKKETDSKTPSMDFESVLKTMEVLETSPQKASPSEKVTDNSTEKEDFVSPLNHGLNDSHKTMIRKQVRRHWTILAGAMGARDKKIKLEVHLLVDGSVEKIVIMEQQAYQNDRFYKAMVDSAIRAVYKSSPFKNLPPELYGMKDGWQILQLIFDPEELL